MISKEEAFNLVKNTSKFAHALVVSTMMRRLAERLGEDGRDWELVGLLHDLDYDETRGDMNRHGVVASERLKGRLPENCLYAIKAHDYRTGFEPKSKLDKALIATDSVAILMEKAGKTPEELDIEVLKAELKRISSEQPWYKSNIFKCREMGLSLDEFLKLCLESLKKPKQ
jgi:predicted hydrolase (HD superfamily)